MRTGIASLIVVIVGAFVLNACGGGMALRRSLPANFKSYGFTSGSKADGQPVRSGSSSMRFEVRAGDCGWNNSGWNDCAHDRERHEMKSGLIFDGEYWFHWSIYLPEDFPIVYPVHVALGQFHQENGHPVWMFQNKAGGYSIENQVVGSTLETAKLLTDEDMRGRWADILVHAKWTHRQDGFFRIYVNGETKPRYSWAGATKTRGKNVYFKFGIYRTGVSLGDGPLPTQIVYYDDLTQARSCEGATTYFDCKAIVTNQASLPRTSDIKICDGRICPAEYDRSVEGLRARFGCWLASGRVQGKGSLPTEGEIETVIGNIADYPYYLSKNKLGKSGLPAKTLAAHSKSLMRLVNYTYSNDRFCAKPVL